MAFLQGLFIQEDKESIQDSIDVSEEEQSLALSRGGPTPPKGARGRVTQQPREAGQGELEEDLLGGENRRALVEF